MASNQVEDEVYLEKLKGGRSLPKPVSRHGLFLDWPMVLISVFGILCLVAMLSAFIYFVLGPVKNCNCNCAGVADNYTSPWWPDGREWRLPENLVPEHYALQLVPDFYGGDPSMFEFTGSVVMRIRCDVITNDVLLNAKDLDITSISVNSITESTVIPTTEVNAENDLQLLRIRMQRNLALGEKITVSLGFKGKLSNGGNGLVYSDYTDAGNTKYFVYTSMGATSARSVFPCFDEPGFKATYELSVRRREGTQVLSNTRAASSTSIGDGWTEVRFEELPIAIPTYHLVLVMGDFKESDIRLYPMKLYGTQDMESSGEQARKIAGPTMSYYNDEMPLTYPLSDFNIVSLPSYGLGYQGNLGTTLFDDGYLEYVASANKVCRLESVTTNLATATGQVWFGSMLTQAWWNDFWIMQGLAIYHGYQAARRTEPDWDWDQMQTYSLMLTTLREDSMGKLPPVYRPDVTRPEHIESLFKCPTNRKAAIIFGMLRDFIHPDLFVVIFENFISNYMYETVSTTQLLDYLDQEMSKAGIDLDVSLKDMISTWLYQMGYPTITMSKTGSGSITVSQQLFQLNPDVPIQDRDYPSPYEYKWEVTLGYSTSTQPARVDKVWLHKTDTTLSLSLGEDDWILGNPGSSGYFRVNYDVSNWSSLGQQLATDARVISTTARAQLVDDVLTFSRSGLVSGRLSMEMIRYMAIQENEWLPFRVLNDHLAFLDPVLQGHANYGAFRGYIRTMCGRRYEALGWDGSSQDPIVLQYQRRLIVWMACSHGLRACVDEASSRFRDWSRDPLNFNSVSPDYQKTVFCTGVADGSEMEWNAVKAAYDAVTDADVKDALRYGLSCTQQPWLLRRWLEMIGEDNSTLSMHDQYQAVVDIIQSASGRDMVMQYDNDWKMSCKMSLGSIMKEFSKVASSQQEMNWAMSFMSENSLHDLISDVRSQIEANMRWLDTNGQQVLEYASQNCNQQCI